jgi:hypothetical protein
MNDKCEMCDAILKSKFVPESKAWDWFTGYLDQTLHFCPVHRRSKEHDEWLELSKVKP